ncbi:MAG: flagellar biosynthesis anti-sigma factor FlgM [Nitrospirota bacterium]|nr:flagellar biosynthesis anti-sigma factor FlgM [Nitrospirota bacterium]
MKIPEKDPNLLLERALLGKNAGVNAAKENKVSKQESPSQSVSADQVDISEKARTLQKLNQLAALGGEVRIERVEQLQAEIKAGTYALDTEKIAEKLLRSTVIDKIL